NARTRAGSFARLRTCDGSRKARRAGRRRLPAHRPSRYGRQDSRTPGPHRPPHRCAGHARTLQGTELCGRGRPARLSAARGRRALRSCAHFAARHGNERISVPHGTMAAGELLMAGKKKPAKKQAPSKSVTTKASKPASKKMTAPKQLT